MAEIKDVTFSKTNVWDADADLIINFTSSVEGSYSVSVNGTILEGDNLAEENISVSIPISTFNLGDNTVTIAISNVGETVTDTFTYNIIKENRDTFSLQRRLQHDLSPVLTGNATLKIGEGIAVSEGVGEVVLTLPTLGKARVSGVLVEQENVGEQAFVLTESMTFVQDEGEGKMYEKELNLNFKDILSITVE